MIPNWGSLFTGAQAPRHQMDPDSSTKCFHTQGKLMLTALKELRSRMGYA